MKNLIFQFQGVDIFTFNRMFHQEVQCKQYLSQYKWKEGFTCPKCGHQKAWKGPDQYKKVCASCRHIDSCTANTLFHKVKFGLVKAFLIVFEMSTTTKSLSSRAMARKYEINKDTAWLFMQKVRVAMGNEQVPLEGKVECGLDHQVNQQKPDGQEHRKKIRIIACVQCQGRGISRQFAIAVRPGTDVSGKLKARIDANATVTCNHLAVNKLLKLDHPKKISRGTVLPRIARFTTGLRNWINGIHHAVSGNYCQRYLDEYCFRLNHYKHKEELFDLTIRQMLDHEPWFYRIIREQA